MTLEDPAVYAVVMDGAATGHLRLFPARRQALEDAQAAAVRRARLQGLTWLQIGEALGITKAAVHKRYASDMA